MAGTRKATTEQRLKEIMAEKGLRQVDLLERCKPFCEKFGRNITKSHLSQWVNGINTPSQENLTILSLALGVSEAWLLGLDVNRRRNETIPMTMPMFPYGDAMDDSPTKPLLMVGIAKLNEEEAQRLLDLARVVFPGKFEWDNDTDGYVEW